MQAHARNEFDWSTRPRLTAPTRVQRFYSRVPIPVLGRLLVTHTLCSRQSFVQTCHDM